MTQKQEGSNRNHTRLSSYFGQFDCDTGIKLHSMWHYKGIGLAFIDKVSRPTFEKCFLQWVTEILMRYDGDECSLKSCLITLDIWIQPDCFNICQETTAQTSSRFCVCGFAARL